MTDLKGRWDELAGLFLTAPDKRGHTADCFGQKNLHTLPDSVSFMAYAAQIGRLAEIDSLRILENMKKCQFHDGDRRGLIKWYVEDRDQTDGNAPFFICFGLVPLRKYFEEELGEKCRALMDDILSEALHYFMKNCAHWSCYYPNAFLGDMVFAWLINEILGNPENDAGLLEKLDGSAKYWIEDGWGWGEHMSDIYAMVCNYQISMLLLMSERLPQKTRGLYMKALEQLLRIEESFGGKPRVPVIRSYSFEETPKARPFRKLIRDWLPDEEIEIYNLPPIGLLLNKLGWHKMAPPPAKPLKTVKVPCFNRSKARAFLKGGLRMGAMSRYPVMECCDYQYSGLSWQSFPVAFLHDDGDWGFLQWLTEEDENTFAHPCHKKNYDRLKGLSAKVNPPIAGKTFSLRKGASFLILRRMPSVSPAWTRLSDRLRIVAPTASFEEKISGGRFSSVTFKWTDGRRLSAARASMSDLPVHDRARVENGMLDWGVEYGRDALKQMTDAITLWAFCVDAEITEPPEISPEALRRRPVNLENNVFSLDWKTGGARWRLKVDPVADNPFGEN